MSKIVRFTGAEQRRWSANRMVILAADGSALRDMTANEARAMVELQHHARVKQTSAQAKTPGEQTIVAVTVKKDSKRGMSAFITVDGMRITDTRAVMRAELLAKWGECQVRKTDGKFLFALRDPNLKRGTARDAMRTAPKPEHCQCKSWGDPHPGKHHFACQHNEHAPNEERGDLERAVGGAPGRVSDEEVRIVVTDQAMASGHKALPSGATVGTKLQNAVVPVTKIPKPSECKCASFARTDGKVTSDETGHHPVCEFAERWSREQHEPYVLVHIDSGEILRPAELQEIAESQIAEKRTGGATVKIGEELFLCMKEADARLMQEGATEVSGEGVRDEERDTEPPTSLEVAGAGSEGNQGLAPVQIEETP